MRHSAEVDIDILTTEYIIARHGMKLFLFSEGIKNESSKPERASEASRENLQPIIT